MRPPIVACTGQRDDRRLRPLPAHGLEWIWNYGPNLKLFIEPTGTKPPRTALQHLPFRTAGRRRADAQQKNRRSHEGNDGYIP